MIKTFVVLLVFAVSCWAARLLHDATVGLLFGCIDKVLRVVAIFILAVVFSTGIIGAFCLVFPDFWCAL